MKVLNLCIAELMDCYKPPTNNKGRIFLGPRFSYIITVYGL